jgi:hypothetical protein
MGSQATSAKSSWGMAKRRHDCCWNVQRYGGVRLRCLAHSRGRGDTLRLGS